MSLISEFEEVGLGYLKYEGSSVEDGIMDAGAAAKALSGFESAVRFFVAQERPDLADIALPVPVRIRRGSWIADIPEHAGTLVATGFGVVALSYLRKAAEKMAERDFEGVGLKDVLIRSMKCIQWMITVSKHLGHSNLKRAKVVWDRVDYAGFVNDAKEILYVPVSFIKALLAAPPSLLAEIAVVVEVERKLTVGVRNGDAIVEVSVSRTERAIFSSEDDDDEILFPEMEHGQRIVIEGVVTRGNEMSNTIGFFHRNHVLTCFPRKGSIVRHKKQFFLTCRLEGEVTRLGKQNKPTELRPKIIFDSLEALSESEQIPLPLDGVEDTES
tara:strand:+ start:684 stop:1667 length:984 start_codon:yes stop_codon:yes gene_type:complete